MSTPQTPLAGHVKKPLVLLILDGFGYSKENKYNAIANAKAPIWSNVCETQPNTTIATSGLEVGLPEGQMGNSEVGHMTLGAGRVIYQNFTRINKAITDGDFFTNPAYTAAVDEAIANDKAVHIFGLLSSGGVHSHEDHLLAALKLAAERGAKKLYLHAFLDGRDTPPRSAKDTLLKAEAALEVLGVGQIASVVGRFYALDRDNRWDRVEQAYNVMVNGKGAHTATSAVQALEAAYARDENDEFVAATTIAAEGQSPVQMEDGDSAIFMNFRPDRAREITHAIIDEDFSGFERERSVKLAHYVMTTEYAADIKAPIAFPPIDVVNSLGEVLQNTGKKQLRIAETEKYAHVTFFFSGGQESLYEGEERVLIPSPDVATYDLKPEMSAEEVTDKLIEAIESNTFDAIICNYANCDQVGHSGVYDAAIKAVETVDACMGRIFASLEKVGGHALVTADHGNVEEMFDEKANQVHTQHTTLPVPLAYVGPVALDLTSGGSLADIAPTMLALMNIEQPAEMTGKNLVKLK